MSQADLQALLRSAPLVDGHNDLLWALRELREKGEPEPDVAGPAPELQTDLPRLAEGCVGGQFWSVYVPSDLAGHEAVTATLEQIDALHRLVSRYPDRLAHARTADDVERIAASGRVASMIGVEGGHSIGDSLGALRMFAALGAGYLTLTHNDDTAWADSATGDHPHGGLTRFGEEVVRELNRCGVLVDLSHVSDDTMRQAIEVSEAPVVFSHSSARALCDVSRDVPDDVLAHVARTRGVVMVAFVPSFLTAEGARANAEAWAQARRLRIQHADDPAALHAAMEAWWADVPEVDASVEDVADHVDHVREVAGIDHVGVGSDFDGAAGMPAGLEDVSRYPALFTVLKDRGYTDEDLRKVAGGNVLRVMREAEAVAARAQAERPPSTATIAREGDG
ncbi:MAG: dipeptidase [Planctomycetaceae bacterium]